jgi:hypothetical protein
MLINYCGGNLIAHINVDIVSKRIKSLDHLDKYNKLKCEGATYSNTESLRAGVNNLAPGIYE